jgi:hypothetical protein
MTDDRPPILEELDGLAIAPAPVGDILRIARTAKRRRRAVLASVAAVSVLLVGGGLVTTQVLAHDSSDSNGAVVGHGIETTPPVSPPTSSGEHAPSASCASGYPYRLAAQAFALDATVVSIAPDGSRATLQTNHWFKGGEDDSVTLDLGDPAGSGDPTSEFSSGYSVGSRLLVSGQESDDGLRTAWKCGYTRDWSQGEADFWGAQFAGVQDLAVTVNPMGEVGDYVAPLLEGSALWRAKERELVYIPETVYNSCLTKAKPSTTHGSTSLNLTPPASVANCDDVTSKAVITITGLTEPPTKLTVTENGEQRTVAVTAAHMELPCSKAQRHSTDLDVPGPGRRTPEEAVASYANGPTLREELPNSVVVHELNANGVVVRTYLISRHNGGWWPDGWLECQQSPRN